MGVIENGYRLDNSRFVDESGVPYGVKHVDNKPRVSAMDYLYDIAEGNVPGHTVLRRLGHNVDVAAALETVWHNSSLKGYLTSAERLQIASSDVDDDGSPVGAGARTLRITGLDTNYEALTEDVTLNGQTNVLTDASFLRVFDLQVLTAGASGANEGTITASNNADAMVLEEIAIGENLSHSACYTVPLGYTAYIVQVHAADASLKGCEFSFWMRVFGGLWTMRRSMVLLDSSIVMPVRIPMAVPAKTDIEIRCEGIAAGAVATAGFEGWLET